MSNKFLVGLVNGLVFNINRKNISPDEQFTMKFECYTGAVHALDRNPFVPKNFLSIGDWSAKIWSEDTRESYLFNTREQKVSLTGGCWSRSRGSIFFTTNKDGLLEAYDILTGMQNPLASIHVCSDSLTAISPNDEGELIAVGSSKGTVYILECLEGLTSFSREDKGHLLSYMEGANRFERVLDNRLREIRLYRSTIDEGPVEHVGKSKAKIKAKEEPKAKKKIEDTKKKPKEDKKLKRVRSKRKESALVDVDLIEAQKRYFEIVEAEIEKMVDIDPEDKAAVQSLLEMRVVMKSEDPSEQEEEDDLPKVRSQKSIRMRKMPRRPRKTSLTVAESDLLIEPIMADDKAGHRGKGARRYSILKTCPLEVCKPEICCKDVMGKRKRLKPKKKISVEDLKPPKMLTPFVIQSKSYQTLADFTDQFEKPTQEMRRKILKQRLLPPSILKKELALAKSAIRRWQEEILAGKLSFRAVKRTISLKSLMSTASAMDPESSDQLAEKMPDHPEARSRTISMLRRGAGKRRRTKVTVEDEEELIEQEKQRRWQELKMKVKEFESKRHSKGTYPRISAARRTSKMEDVP
nr:uncharacterized protein LOC117222945 [Megalopta genalis]